MIDENITSVSDALNTGPLAFLGRRRRVYVGIRKLFFTWQAEGDGLLCPKLVTTLRFFEVSLIACWLFVKPCSVMHQQA